MKLFLLLLLSTSLWSTQIDATLFEGDLKERYQKLQQSFSDRNISTPDAKEQLQYHQSLVSKIKKMISSEVKIETPTLEKLQKEKITQEVYQDYFDSLINFKTKQREAKEKYDTLQEKIGFLKNRIEKIEASEKDLLLSLQLQFAIYKLRQHKAKETQKQSEIAYNTLYTPLPNALEKVSFKIEKTQQEKTDKEIKVLDKKIVALQVKKERQLITAEQVDPAIEKQLESYQKEIEKLYLKQIGFKVTKLLELIQAKSSEELFNELHNLEALFSNIKGGEELHDEYGDVLQSFIKTKLGTMTVLFSSMKQNTQQIVYDFFEWFSNPLFVYNEQPVSMIDIFKILLILIVGFFIGWLYKKRVLSLREKQVKMSLMSIRLLANIGYYIIIFITFIIALGSIGLDLTSLSLIAGALSIGIGFGLQTVVSNFVAGIILMFERSIRIGDLLEIDGTFKGEVTDIRIRSTTIKTFDNIEVIVPNATFIQQNVINWTLEDKIRRLHIPFSVAYGTDVDMLIETLLGALEKSSLNYLRNHTEKKPKVWMTAMGGSSLDMELLVWIKSGIKDMPLPTDFLILIYKTLNEHKIEIPFPQMDVHLKKD